MQVGAEALALHRVSPELLDGLHGWAESRDAPFAMHLSYSEAAARHAVDEHGRALLRVLADRGVLDHRFLGHHPVWIDDTEIAALTAAGAGVSVCAPANMLIGTKAAPLPSLIAAGTRIGLGTDQPNDGHDFFAVMKGTVLQQRAQHQSTEFGSPELMLELATIGGARAMHLEAEIGSIEAGKRADLVVVDARRPTLNPGVSAVSNLVYAASPGDVESVFVDGVEIVRHGVPLAWEIEDTVDTVNRVVECALRRHGLAPLLVTSWPVVDGGGTVERGRE
jgi:5-methylthioadenosine/S-adenosylhomocysteine deaminase